MVVLPAALLTHKRLQEWVNYLPGDGGRVYSSARLVPFCTRCDTCIRDPLQPQQPRARNYQADPPYREA